MNKTDKLNECIACKCGSYSNSEFSAAKLTGSKFKFNCTHAAEQWFITTKTMQQWHNHCVRFKPK